MVTDSQSVSYLSDFLSNFIETTKILVSNPYWRIYVGSRINYRLLVCDILPQNYIRFVQVCVCVWESYDFQLHAVLFDIIPVTLGSTSDIQGWNITHSVQNTEHFEYIINVLIIF